MLGFVILVISFLMLDHFAKVISFMNSFKLLHHKITNWHLLHRIQNWIAIEIHILPFFHWICPRCHIFLGLPLNPHSERKLGIHGLRQERENDLLFEKINKFIRKNLMSSTAGFEPWTSHGIVLQTAQPPRHPQYSWYLVIVTNPKTFSEVAFLRPFLSLITNRLT